MSAAALHVVQVGSDDSVFFSPSDAEPIERQRHYARLLAERAPGSQLTNLVLTRRREAQPFADEGLRFEPIVAGGAGWRRVAAWSRLRARLETLHRERPISVISTQSVQDDAWIVLKVAGRLGVPVVGQIHFDMFSPAAVADMSRIRLAAKIRTALIRRYLPRFAAIRVVGREIARQLHVRGLHEQVHILPVPVPVVNTAPQCGTLETRPWRVLFVGRLVNQKNLEGWLRVAAMVAKAEPAAEFAVVGEGPLRPALEARVASLGLADRVSFTGLLRHEELSAAYASARVFLLSSHYEGFGRVVVEAYAHGTPVVATRITGVEDIVMDGVSGFLRQVDDEAGLADGVLTLLRDPHLGGRMAAAGLSHVRARFDPALLARQWVGLLVNTALHASP